MRAISGALMMIVRSHDHDNANDNGNFEGSDDGPGDNMDIMLTAMMTPLGMLVLVTVNMMVR